MTATAVMEVTLLVRGGTVLGVRVVGVGVDPSRIAHWITFVSLSGSHGPHPGVNLPGCFRSPMADSPDPHSVQAPLGTPNCIYIQRLKEIRADPCKESSGRKLRRATRQALHALRAWRRVLL